MGLFRKGSPAEKKLKELTGGFLLSTAFTNRLKDNGLKTEDGIKIKNKLKEEIKSNKINEFNIETRLTELINEFSNVSTVTSEVNSSNQSSSYKKKCPKCNKSQDADNNVCIYCGHKFIQKPSQKRCPACNQYQDDDNAFCINCGYDFKNKIINETKIQCPNCKKEQYIKNKTCTDCGYDFNSKKLPEFTKTCPKCGITQKAARLFCCNCREDMRQIDYDNNPSLVECPKCNRKIPKDKDPCPFCKTNIAEYEVNKINDEKKKQRQNELKSIDFVNNISFLANYNHNIKICPDCNTQLLKSDPFCFNCGATVITNETVKNDNLEVRDGKLVAKDENNNSDELSDLEALYAQTVQSKYAPSFKIAYVLYLEAFRKNPSKKFSDKIAKRYDTTPNKLKKQALKDEFIEPAPAISEAKSFKVSELKEILKKHDLKVSGKKDELIDRLSENLTEDELKKYFKSKNYQMSEKGCEFLSNNNYILYIYNNSDISRVFYPSEIGKIFEEREYSMDEIYEKLIVYLKRILDEKLTQELWIDFKSYSNAIAEVLEDKGDLKEALNIRLKVFLFDINNFSVVLSQPDPKTCRIKNKDVSKLNNLLHKLSLPIDELKELFEKSFDELLFKTVITSQDSLIYLLKIFGGEDLEVISAEIRDKYSNPY